MRGEALTEIVEFLFFQEWASRAETPRPQFGGRGYCMLEEGGGERSANCLSGRNTTTDIRPHHQRCVAFKTDQAPPLVFIKLFVDFNKFATRQRHDAA